MALFKLWKENILIVFYLEHELHQESEPNVYKRKMKPTLQFTSHGDIYL